MKKWILILTVLLLTACGGEPEGDPVSAFSFTDQHGNEFGTEQLAGKVWIADFIFTNCDTVCPPMTYKMADIQAQLEEEGLEAEIVSFSVDPEIDSPEVLQDYLAQFTDNQDNWHALTGYSQAEIERFALDEFQTLVNKPENTDQVLHGVTFYVMDQESRIVNEYNFTEEDVVDKIIADVKRIQ
ncbi:SCO family protein [Jeotgalibacillus sp. R-1-5s-1]|uniref:SCO family protein n=1 Tax=Jeotgalibacillus sp. R-1-5s-1 TaxID=2555897 RepID=UPI00106B3FBF|nr:SCO family protein [Jeotgalibacillus sp. R-1-5s-1]TFE00760.1 SCO family protein [Jeotgalibacillus sp. R-1-5s-1]